MPHIFEGLITRDEIANIAANEQLRLDDEDRISVLEAMHSIDVQACPGSGKTTLIATKLILLAKKWPYQHQGVCVLSHTNVAKDEIINRLKRSNTLGAQRLLSYPHFIGTIQEFVNRFLALPAIRQSGVGIKFLDGDDGGVEVLRSGENINSLYSSLYYKCGGKKKPWPKNDDVFAQIVRSLGSLFWLNTNFDLALYGNFGSLDTYKNDPDKKIFPKLENLKKALENKGIYQYRDMFVFAEQLLTQNSMLRQVISRRFPYVLLDEMQDTQKFQDELLCTIFSLNDPNVVVQRFGDPDQAIFHGMGSEEPNESFNRKSRDDMDFVIHKSHRFDAMLADKIKHFSLNEVPLESEVSAESATDRAKAHVTNGDFQHTIIVFNDDTCGNVVEYFARIVSEQFAANYRYSPNFSAKVIGAVGNEIDPNKDQLKIGHYWPTYDKTKSQKNFKEASLVDAVRYCHLSSTEDFAQGYQFLIDCFLRLLKMVGSLDKDGRNFSATTFRKSLEEREVWNTFRKEICLMLNNTDEINQQNWQKTCNRITSLLDLKNIPAEAAEYLSFTTEPAPADVAFEENQHDLYCVSLPGNKIKHSDGFEIELSTIHGVKGETHDATLIVETKNYTFDLESMLPYLTGELPSENCPNTTLKERPTNSKKDKPNQVFMRQLYVGMSRPRYLLCLALHTDRLSEADRDILNNKGWKIEAI